MLKCTLPTPMSSLGWLQFRRQQICSLSPTRDKSGHVCSLATVQNQTRICTESKHGPVNVWPRIRQSESYSCFVLWSNVCLFQSQHQNPRPTRGEMLTPNPNECNSTLSSITGGTYPHPDTYTNVLWWYGI